MAAGDADVGELTIIHRAQRLIASRRTQNAARLLAQIAERAGETAKGGCGSGCGLRSRDDRSHGHSPVVMQRQAPPLTPTPEKRSRLVLGLLSPPRCNLGLVDVYMIP